MRICAWSMLMAAVFTAATTCEAVTIGLEIPGRTSSIGNGFTDVIHPSGSHFHTSNLPDNELPSGNPPVIPVEGIAEVGGFFGDEEVRGVSEFDLRGQGNASAATVLIDVFDVSSLGLTPDPIDGLFGQGPLDGWVDIYAYEGDNVESTSDYSADLLQESPLMSLDVPTLTAGDTIPVDVTSLYNQLINDMAANPDDAVEALGIRIQTQIGLPDSLDAGAVTFSNFRLQLVPEPSSIVLVLMAFVILTWKRP